MESEFVDHRALRRISARSVSRESLALRAGDRLCRTTSRLTIDRRQASTLANPTPSGSLLDRCAPRIARRPVALLIAALVAMTMMAASAAAQVQLPEMNISDPLTIAADSGNRFKQGSYEVLILHGNCYVNQGLTYARCDDAVLWVDRTGTRDNPQFKIIAYLEGNVTIDYQPAKSGDGKNEGKPQARITDKTWFGRFTTNLPLTIHIDKVSGEPAVKPPVYLRGMKARDPSTPDAPGGLIGSAAGGSAANGSATSGVTTAMGSADGSQGSGVQQAQLTAPGAAPRGSTSASGSAPATVAPPARPQAGPRRLRAFPRSDTRVQAQVFPNPSANETIVVVTSGINLIVDGIEGYGVIDMSADRIVMWKQGAAPDLTGQSGENSETPLELYMEGNVIFRQGDRVIFADRMYYDVPSKRGIILQAEILTPAPSYSGLLRLRADVLRQVGENQYTADRGGVTSSRLGVPTFELRSSQLNLTDEQFPKTNFFTGQPEVDPATGEPVIEHRRQAISKNNILFVGPVPVFYWPVMATDLEEPNYYLQSIRFGEDEIFGDQIRLSLNAFQLLGRKRPPGTTWTVSADYFSLRGPAAGTQFRFDRSDFFGLVQGHSYGILDIWGIHDSRGYDTLGLDRLADTFTNPDRGRVLLRDRQMLPNNFQFTFEVGYISDRNFLEQYFETEWDQLKNQSTGFELKQYVDNADWSLTSDVRVNNFFTETNWLPRLDHYSLGKSLFGDRVTWFEHSDVGYGQFRTLTPPTSSEDKAVFSYLPWETPGGQQGDREVTAQELDLPFSVGVLKFTPYVMGQLAHWGQALNYQGLERAYGQVGVRASVPFWSVNPLVDSDLLNVHGIAHKVVLEANVFAADATQSVTQLPLYDTIDDNAILAFRRQFGITTFGGVTPFQLDPRFYAIRAGLGGDVTNPAAEVVGTMAEVQLTARQRWQTKRGPAANRKVVDWISLNTSATFYPDPSRDDFGSVVGLVNYDFTWFVGDRVTVMSDGFYDFFTNGAKYTTIGAFLNRPPRSSFYAGVRSLAGPLHSTALISSYSYRMSPKWFSSFGTSYVLGGQGNVGENFNLTRIGEAFLLSVGGNVDASKGNVGFMFGVEPRFLGNKARFGATTGALIPPAGAFGLE